MQSIEEPGSPSAPRLQVSPSTFDTFIIRVEVRTNPSLGLTDHSSYVFQLPVSLLLHEDYKYIPSEKLRPSHLSWGEFCAAIQRKCGFELDLNKCELGFTTKLALEGFGTEYFKITSELTFQNALAVLFNDWEWTEQLPTALPLQLWSPKPTEPVFRRSPRARDPNIPLREPLPKALRLPPPELQSQSPSSALVEVPKPAVSSPSAQPQSPLHTTTKAVLPHPHYIIIDDESELNRAADDVRDREPSGKSTPEQASRGHVSVSSSSDESESNMPDESESNKAVEIDTQWLLDQLKSESQEEPDREQFENDEQFEQAMEAYVDYMRRLELARLQEGCDSEACMHFDDNIWKEVCCFFHHDIKLTKPEYCVHVPGRFFRKLLPVQIHGVWYCLREIHGIAGSVFLCHIMGIGKTTIAFAVHHVQHVFNQMWGHIRKNPLQHHSEDHPRESCPSNSDMLKRYGFDCPCHPKSPGHWLKQRLGVSVALVPLGLLNVWKFEHQKCFQDEESDAPPACGFVMAHGSANNVNDEMKQILLAQLVTQGGPQERSVFQATLDNGSVFVVTTPDSLDTQFLKKFTIRKSYQYTPPPTIQKNGHVTHHYPKTLYTEGFLTIIVRLLFRDEFQLRKLQTETAIKRLQSLQNKDLAGTPRGSWKDRAYHRFSIIAMSGTPLMMGPLDIASFVDMMSWPRWQADNVLRDWMSNELKELGTTWNNWTSKKTHDPNDRTPHNVNAKLGPLVEKLMIRWTTSSKLCGEQVVKVPKNLYQDIACDNGPVWNERLQSLGDLEKKKLEEKERLRKKRWLQAHKNLNNYKPLDKTNINVYYRSRVCASFPALIDLKDEEGNSLRLSEIEWQEMTKGSRKKGIPVTWVQETDSDPYFKNLEAIVASSAKLKEIKKKIESFSDLRDGEGKVPRCIFFSYFFVGGYIIYLWMKYILKIPKRDLIWVYKPLGQDKINKELARFHINLDSETPPKEQHTARFIIATSSSFAVGLTLAEAKSVGNLEPDYHADTVAQAFHRHCRQGNKNKVVHSWSFYAKDNQTEGRIREVSALRKLIEHAASRKVNKAMHGVLPPTSSSVAGPATRLATRPATNAVFDDDIYNAEA